MTQAVFYIHPSLKDYLKTAPKWNASKTHNERRLIIQHGKWERHKCPERWVWTVLPLVNHASHIHALQSGPDLQAAWNKMWQKWYSDSSGPEPSEGLAASTSVLLEALNHPIRGLATMLETPWRDHIDQSHMEKPRNRLERKRPSHPSSQLSPAPANSQPTQPREGPRTRPAEERPSQTQPRSRDQDQIKINLSHWVSEVLSNSSS